MIHLDAYLLSILGLSFPCGIKRDDFCPFLCAELFHVCHGQSIREINSMFEKFGLRPINKDEFFDFFSFAHCTLRYLEHPFFISTDSKAMEIDPESDNHYLLPGIWRDDGTGIVKCGKVKVSRFRGGQSRG